MKKRLFAVLTCLSAIMPIAAAAQNALDPARLNLIQQRCTTLQTSLDQLQRRDLVARTNRGRAYEDQINQINAFTQRLRNTNISSDLLDGPANDFKADVDDFRSTYVQYDNSMNTLRQIDCRNKPVDFANNLEQTKVLREEVGAAVTKSEQDLTAYRQAIVTLQAQVPEATGGTQ